MNDSTFITDEIRRVIKASVFPCYENTSKTEIYCRCPNCGDSKKNKLAAHFYIQMRPPFKYYCQKCGFSGKLDQDILNKLQIYDNNILLNITSANKSIQSKLVYHQKKIKDITYTDEENEITQAAVKYFNDRFNTNYSLQELNSKFKCICNPKKFLQEMDIDLAKSKFDFSKAIGFLSSDNKYLICRDISGKQEIRYSNTSLSDDEDKSKIYNIKLPINLLTDKVTLVVTEGIFDCIGVYLKKYLNTDETVIIAAGCGKSFSQVIEKFLKLGFLNLNIEIYSDADVDISMYRSIKKSKYYLQNEKISVFYNTLGKDCGVSSDKISLTKTII